MQTSFILQNWKQFFGEKGWSDADNNLRKPQVSASLL